MYPYRIEISVPLPALELGLAHCAQPELRSAVNGLTSNYFTTNYHHIRFPTMSLYHEAAKILDVAGKGHTSLKSEIFGKKEWKTDRKTLYAVTSEAAKWSSVLSEVVERSGMLKAEKQVLAGLTDEFEERC